MKLYPRQDRDSCLLRPWCVPLFWCSSSTAIQYRINSLTKQNIQLEDEITNLEIQIEGAVSFETIENYAIRDLKMAYPKESQCVYIEDGMEVSPGLANTIRDKVYGN